MWRGWDANEVEPGFVATRVIRGRALFDLGRYRCRAKSSAVVRARLSSHGNLQGRAVLPGRSEAPDGCPTGCPKAPFILEMRESVTGDDGTTEFVVHAQGDHID